jgi:hypothetical protein
LYSLQQLYLCQNQLSGPIPTSVGKLEYLENFYVYSNQLTGTLPSSLGNLSTLINFSAQQNKLTGTLPTSLSDMKNLISLSLFQNQLTGTIPTLIGNMGVLKDIYLYENMLTGTIPSSLGNLRALQELNLFSNALSGTIPESFDTLPALEFFIANENQLTGTIPALFGNLTFLVYLSIFDNRITGSIPVQLSELRYLEYLFLNKNQLTGTIPASFGYFNDSNNSFMIAIMLSENLLTGMIPYSLFQGRKLFSVVLAENCLTGTLPETICDSPALTQLILDGLHSASICSDKAIPGLPSSGLIAKNSVHGHIPSCLLQHKHLSVLHLGGNSFSGSIPNVPISAAMTELVLSSNQLTGSIPDSIWQSNITKLDLSLNRLQGTLPSDMLPTAQLQLQLERMNISKSKSSKNSSFTVSVNLKVNQLAGAIPTWLESLPSGDIDILEGNLFSCNADRSDLPANDPIAATYECGSDNTNSGLIAFGAALVCVGMISSVFRYYVRGGSPSGSAVEMSASFHKHYGQSKVNKLWEHIERAVYVIVGMWMLGMLVYGLLSLQFSSYVETYVWAVSAIFKSGIVSSLTMLLCLVASLLIILIHTDRWSLINFDSSSSRTDLPNNVSLSKGKYVDIMVCVGFCLINIMVVTVVNGLYISSIVSSQYPSQTLLVISFFLSLFKLAWNYMLLRGSQYIKHISDRTVVWLCLFNNLLAPLLAEMFVSSDCFLYIVTQASALIFTYDVYQCQIEYGYEASYYGVCSVAVLSKQGYGIPVNVSMTPPFHYSYQCSFSLLSSYISVFTFRYINSAIVEPLLRTFLYYCNDLVGYGSSASAAWNIASRLLSTFWKSLLKLQNNLKDPIVFQKNLNSFGEKVQKGKFRRRIVVLLVTDLTMLICFGALFPPLAVIIALSVLKDVMSIRLALGRYCEIMEAVQDESLKEQMVKVREAMDEEMLKAGAGIWNGVWHGMVMGTWIWGFVLFDTMASVEGVGKGLAVLMCMLCCPFILHYGLQIIRRYTKRNAMRNDDRSRSSVHDSTTKIDNPILTKNRHVDVEMVILTAK